MRKSKRKKYPIFKRMFSKILIKLPQHMLECAEWLTSKYTFSVTPGKCRNLEE